MNLITVKETEGDTDLLKQTPLLRKKNVKARPEFARSHIHLTRKDWKEIIFSDEYKVQKR